MDEFKRENRYIVIKRKELELLNDDAREDLDNILAALSIAKQPDIDTGANSEIECVVVDRDWPIYEETWENVQRLSEGRPSIRDELQSELAAARAQCERLREYILKGAPINTNPDRCERKKLLMEAPEQNLAEIEARAISRFVGSELPQRFVDYDGEAIAVKAKKYIDRLRQQAEGDPK